MQEPFTVMHTIDTPGHPLEFRVYPFEMWGHVQRTIERAREITEETPHAISFVVMAKDGDFYREDAEEDHWHTWW